MSTYTVTNIFAIFDTESNIYALHGNWDVSILSFPLPYRHIQHWHLNKKLCILLSVIHSSSFHCYFAFYVQWNLFLDNRNVYSLALALCISYFFVTVKGVAQNSP